MINPRGMKEGEGEIHVCHTVVQSDRGGRISCVCLSKAFRFSIKLAAERVPGKRLSPRMTPSSARSRSWSHRPGHQLSLVVIGRLARRCRFSRRRHQGIPSNERLSRGYRSAVGGGGRFRACNSIVIRLESAWTTRIIIITAYIASHDVYTYIYKT